MLAWAMIPKQQGYSQGNAESLSGETCLILSAPVVGRNVPYSNHITYATQCTPNVLCHNALPCLIFDFAVEQFLVCVLVT